MRKLKPETKQKILKAMIVALIIGVICLSVYLPLKLSGTLEKIDSAEKLKQIILDFGAYSYIIFFVIQFLQVTFLPLPAFVTTVAGTLIFGPLIASAISFVAVMLGSLFAFFLGKKIGRKLVVWVAGAESAKKWEQKLRRGNFVFFLMMLFPVFPDDILCIVAGTVGMSYKFFIITNLITRPIAILTTCFLGSGTLIPFSGWGIFVWIILAILVAILFVLTFKYQPQIEAYIEKLGTKFSSKKRIKCQVSNNENEANTNKDENTNNRTESE